MKTHSTFGPETFASNDVKFMTMGWVVQILGGNPNLKTHVPMLKILLTKFFQNFYRDPWPGPIHIPKHFSTEKFWEMAKIRLPKTANFKNRESHPIIQAFNI